jgi:hypothetical protein
MLHSTGFQISFQHRGIFLPLTLFISLSVSVSSSLSLSLSLYLSLSFLFHFISVNLLLMLFIPHFYFSYTTLKNIIFFLYLSLLLGQIYNVLSLVFLYNFG